MDGMHRTTKEAKPRHKEPTLRTDSTEEVEATQTVYKQNNKLDPKETQSPDLKRPDPTQQPTKP
ncbi:hypothetical protein C5167_021945 [Papaver somniferum]|uniref:Uncharacterized protein n=1 Tax=Papaver somniferum TaxID=3469 RepID=A0A4Y7JK99_PAPSO|nr:hypothetical protein C5167_021945 [Papaver somniferum]